MASALTAGGSFGDYRVVRLLGKGGMGEVWLLENATGGQLAAKILTGEADHEARRRFLREAELALGVKHPNLVEVFDVGEDPDTGLCYILMEYVPGGTLADVIKDVGPLPIEDAVAVVQSIALVLELAREKGIVHRDIKPTNIMFGADGTPKLADLGIARGGMDGIDTTTVTQTGVMIGTPAYMAPEQMLDAHHVDTRADIYSLGVVFFEMLTGVRPNKDDTIVQLMAKAVKGDPLPDVRTLRPEVSASLAQLLALMVAPKKDGRIATPGQVLQALERVERGEALRLHPSPHLRRRRKRQMLMAALGVLALFGMAGIAAGVWCLLYKDSPPAVVQPVAKPIVQPVAKPIVQPVAESVVVKTPEPVSEKETEKEVEKEVEAKVAPPEVVPVRVTAEDLKGVTITVKPSCARFAGIVTNWTGETIRELRRQMGEAYDEKCTRMSNEIIVGTMSEAPTNNWQKIEPGFSEQHFTSVQGQNSNRFVAEGWEGLPNESAHGRFVVCTAMMASGFHYDYAKAEIRPIAWGLKDALGLTVARRLGYGAAADTWLAYLRRRAETVMRSRGIALTDVSADGDLRTGAVAKNPNAGADYTWIVEYRITKLFDELMREKPDVMHDYFAARNEYRRTHGGNKARISAQAFATLLGRVSGKDVFAALDIDRDAKYPLSKTPSSPRNQPALTKEDVEARLKKTVIGKMSFGQNATIVDVVSFFREELGLNFMLKTMPMREIPVLMRDVSVSNIKAGEALKLALNDLGYKYEIHDNIITVFHKEDKYQWTPVPDKRAAHSLRSVRIAEFSLRPPMTVLNFVEFMRGVMREKDGTKERVSWVVETDPGGAPPMLPLIHLREVSAWNALDIACRSCDMRFTIDGNFVTIQSLNMTPSRAKKNAEKSQSRFSKNQILRTRDDDAWTSMRKATELLFPKWRICEDLRKTIAKSVPRGSQLHGCGFRYDEWGRDTLVTCGTGEILETKTFQIIGKGDELRFKALSVYGVTIGVTAFDGLKQLDTTYHDCTGKEPREVVVDLSSCAGKRVRLQLIVEHRGFAEANSAPRVAWSDIEIRKRK